MLLRAAVDVQRPRFGNLAAVVLLAPALACGSSGASAISNEGGLESEAGAVAHDGGDDSEAEASIPAFCVDAAPTQTCIAADIHASNYDQTCLTNSDCVLVVEGYACGSCSACAPLAAINSSAVSRYEADVAKIVGPTTGGGGCAPCLKRPAADACAIARASARSTVSNSGPAASRGSTSSDDASSGVLSLDDRAELFPIVRIAAISPAFRFRRREA
jgi:hypothetical protein